MTTLVQPKSMRMSVNGLDLHYLDWGNVGAPPVVCVHGYTSSAEAFNALARQFHDRFHIVAPDVRGHGESAWSPDSAYQYRDQVADLAGLVDQLGLARFTLIGTSMGGIIAMAFAAAHAARLVGLVINDIGPDVEEGSQRITQMVGGRPDEFATLEDAMAYRREISPVTASRPMSDQREVALGVLRQQADGRWVWKMDPAYIRQRVQHGAPPRPALWPVLKSLPCPTLVVWGTESDVLLEAQARRMVGVLPRGELVKVAGVAHAPTLVEPVVLAALERFLGAQAVSRT
ncbi:MAG: alpha/beta hydrolase [Candidatus Rokuibacteriota bacterium]|nr:MAG: alpha/beta hydrolase [Candidatus Rokubacteria bacterium]